MSLRALTDDRGGAVTALRALMLVSLTATATATAGGCAGAGTSGLPFIFKV